MDNRDVNVDVLKNGSIILALATAISSAAYNHGALNAEHDLNNASRAEQKIISENVIEMRVQLKFLEELVREMRKK